mgnify:CR=1 FL=1
MAIFVVSVNYCTIIAKNMAFTKISFDRLGRRYIKAIESN